MEASTTHGSKPLGFFFTISGGLLWALGGSCGQQIFQNYNLTANWLVPYRILIAGILLLGLSCLRYPPRHVLSVWKNRRDAKDLLLFSIFGAGASQYTYYTCIQYSNAAFATVISYMFPVIILLYGIFRSRRAPKRYELVSVILVTVGAFTCTTHWKLDALSVSPIALVIGILAAVFSAYNTVKPQRLLRTYALISIMGWSMVVGGVVLCLLCRPWTIPFVLSGKLVFLMSVVILGGTIFAFSLFQAGVRIVGSLSGGILASVEPIGAIVIAVLFLNVPFTVEDFVGFVLILATIPLIALGQNREALVARAMAEDLAAAQAAATLTGDPPSES